MAERFTVRAVRQEVQGAVDLAFRICGLGWTRPPTQGPSWGYLKVNFSETLSIFGNKRPRNGSKNGEMAPRTGTGYPHIGPFVAKFELFAFELYKQLTPTNS